jgi:hypothetical protein
MTRDKQASGRWDAPPRPSFAELLSWVPRAVNPVPAVVAVAGALALLGWQWQDLWSSDRRLWLVREGSVMVVLGVLYLLDDPARRCTAAAVTTLRRRTTVTLVVATAVIAGAFAVLVAVASLRGDMGSVLGGVAVEVAAVATVGLAVTLLLQRTQDLDEPATPGALTVLALLALVPVVDLRWPLLVDPGPEWPAAHLRWAAVAAGAVLTLVWVTRDPVTTLRGTVRRVVSSSATVSPVAR